VDEDRLDRDLAKLGSDRRTFIKRMVVGAAFATPIVSSFSMSGLTANSPAAAAPNSSLPPPPP
jgi:hypothetical protein